MASVTFFCECFDVWLCVRTGQACFMSAANIQTLLVIAFLIAWSGLKILYMGFACSGFTSRKSKMRRAILPDTESVYLYIVVVSSLK